jgi:four helix bundle suffix protein
MTPSFIPPHGGYEHLLTYRKSLIIFKATYYLAARWVRRGSRTRDQMEQSARSGKQNIVEGSLASATSKQTEIHLTNVARASLGELLEDFKDMLILRDLPLWPKEAPRTMALRALGRDDATYETYRTYIESDDPEVVGNVMVCLCSQACYLLDQQIRQLEQAFVKEGGIRERMTQARLQARDQAEHVVDAPACPLCNKPMRQRIARQGVRAGQKFWGCTGYPECKGTRPFDGKEKP